jgi:streptogrisin B
MIKEKKMKGNLFRKVTVALLSVVVVCMFSGFSPDTGYYGGLSEQERQSVAKYDESLLLNMEKANESYQKLMDAYSPDSDGLPKLDEWPDYYGGSYVNDSGKLTIMVLSEYHRDGSLVKIKAHLQKKMGTDDFLIQECKYSYGYLTEIMDVISNGIVDPKNEKILKHFVTSKLCDDKNKIIVELDEINADRIEEFKKNICDAPCVEFTLSKSQNVPTATVNLSPGCRVSLAR